VAISIAFWTSMALPDRIPGIPKGGIDDTTLASGKPNFFTTVSHFENPFPLKHITTGIDPTLRCGHDGGRGFHTGMV